MRENLDTIRNSKKYLKLSPLIYSVLLTTKFKMSTENKAETKQTNFKALEEDDEFEDFPVQGKLSAVSDREVDQLTTEIDWPNDKTITAEKQEHLWDESWNDDDNEDDFTKRLRQELANAEAKK
ncbi:Hypothetical protein PAS_chr4_0299 [Komagataella phaffii GS115]|uniref:26S proteasome complex subunit SEM1 n=1 Tax=Komagataella phaffii (strain GS115 / ATCC 20864) TaxID=644223 RepID=C4R7G2_KOMPG|nr:Hypothetical protein PAS_chr4_0299 [Komagataella phaffii GS115]AOA64426.1 GQ67_04631T0 [Komagataella phaffii]AOA69571.1 GQ68_04603T0 [Komagataella phaffii GS115]CAY71537.1 Hypothetical protein PAS_chr4_0299 [Komagataella phaffii GS115]